MLELSNTKIFALGGFPEDEISRLCVGPHFVQQDLKMM